MLTFTEKDLRSKIRRDLGEDTESILFLPFKDLRNSIVEDVQLLKDSPLVLDVPITGGFPILHQRSMVYVLLIGLSCRLRPPFGNGHFETS